MSYEGHGEDHQERHSEKEARGFYGRGKSRDEGAGQRDGGGRGQGGRGKRRARQDRRDAGTGSRHGQAAPCHRQSQRTGPVAKNVVWDARVRQGRQGRLLLPKRSEVQDQVRDVRLQRRGAPRRRHHVAERLRSDGVDRRRRGKDRRAPEESGELRTDRASPSWRLEPDPADCGGCGRGSRQPHRAISTQSLRANQRAARALLDPSLGPKPASLKKTNAINWMSTEKMTRLTIEV